MPVNGQKVGRLTVQHIVGKSKNGSYLALLKRLARQEKKQN